MILEATKELSSINIPTQNRHHHHCHYYHNFTSVFLFQKGLDKLSKINLILIQIYCPLTWVKDPVLLAHFISSSFYSWMHILSLDDTTTP